MDILHLPPPFRQLLLCRVAFHTISRSSTTASKSAVQYDPTPLPKAPPALHTPSSSDLNVYSLSKAPNVAQLNYAHIFFTSAPPEYLFTAAHFRSFPPSPHPEVAFLGRSNVGKSSLLNALFGRTNIKDAHVSKRPGRTRTMNGFGVTGGAIVGTAPNEGQREAAWKRFPRGGCVVVDMPGYGSGSHEEWGREALKYLEMRKQLRRTFVLVDAVHGLKNSDIQILTHLRRRGISHQVILSKVDKLLHPGSKWPGPQKLTRGLLKLKETCRNIQERLDAEAGDGRKIAADILCCSAEKGVNKEDKHQKIGIDEVRWAVISACGLECDQQGNKSEAWVQDVSVWDD